MNRGVYAIVHKPSGRTYVGSTMRTFDKRWRLHRQQLKNGNHHSKYLQRVWDKYGAESFEFVVLEECEPDVTVKTEQRFIDELKPVFNTVPFAGTTRGHKHTNDTRRKMSASRAEKAQKYLVGGEWLSIRHISVKYGFSIPCLRERLQNGADGDKLIAPKKSSNEGRGKKYLVHGEMVDVAGMIARYGVTEDLVRGRLKSGWSGDDLVLPPTPATVIGSAVGDRNKAAAKRFVVNGEPMTLTELSEKYGISRNILSHRARRGLIGAALIAA